MISKSSRLSRDRFAEVFKKGVRRESDLFRIITSPRPPNRYCASAVVSKKVSLRAVRRNTLRRRVYRALDGIDKISPLSGSIIVIAKPTAAEATYQDIFETLSAVVGRRTVSR